MFGAPFRSNIYALLHPRCSFNERGIILLHKDLEWAHWRQVLAVQRGIRWDGRTRRVRSGSGSLPRISCWGVCLDFRLRERHRQRQGFQKSFCEWTHTHTVTEVSAGAVCLQGLYQPAAPFSPFPETKQNAAVSAFVRAGGGDLWRISG